MAKGIAVGNIGDMLAHALVGRRDDIAAAIRDEGVAIIIRDGAKAVQSDLRAFKCLGRRRGNSRDEIAVRRQHAKFGGAAMDKAGDRLGQRTRKIEQAAGFEFLGQFARDRGAGANAAADAFCKVSRDVAGLARPAPSPPARRRRSRGLLPPSARPRWPR